MKISVGSARWLVATCCTAMFGCACVLAVFAQPQPQPQPTGDRHYQAIRADNFDDLRKLVGEIGVNAEEGSGMAPLTLAAAFGTRAAVNVLVEAAPT